VLASDEAKLKVPLEVADAGGSTQSPEQQKTEKRTSSKEQSQSGEKAAM